MKRPFHILCVLSVLAPTWGQVPTDDISPGDFPALQLLPPGSLVKGISLPRYEKHRVSALITAAEMEVQTRSLIRIKKLHAAMYTSSKETTTINSAEASYDFHDQEIRSNTLTDLQHPLFTAKGQGVKFNTKQNIGFLQGPIHTTLSADALSRKKG